MRPQKTNEGKEDDRMQKNRAVLYLRLSKEDADKCKNGDDSASIQNQRLLLADYALSQGLHIVGVYSDDDESGLYDSRPDFEKMMEDARLGKFDLIIAKTQSRFSRNMEHIEKYLHHDLPNLGIRFIGVVDGVDTKDDANKKSRQINGLVNEWYCEDLSKNIRSALKAKMKNGQFLGSSCPYGYRKDPENHNHLMIDPYAADVVRRIYRLYVSGYGKAKIGAILSGEGILIPTLYKQQVLGENYYNAKALSATKAWSAQTIHTILNNETYLGHLIQNKANTISYKDKKKKALPKEQWIIARDTHQPIIEEELFAMAKRQQEARTRSVCMDSQNSVFSGLIFCADCKHAMSRNYARHGERGFIGYICKTYKTKGKQFCASHIIGIRELEEAVLRSLQEEARRHLAWEDIEFLKNLPDYAADMSQVSRQFAQIQKRLEKTARFQQKNYQNFMEGLVSKEEYIAYRAQCEKEQERLCRQQSAAEQALRQKQETEEAETAWDETFIDYIRIPSLTRDVALEMIDRIEVGEDGGITVYYKFKA